MTGNELLKLVASFWRRGLEMAAWFLMVAAFVTLAVGSIFFVFGLEWGAVLSGFWLLLVLALIVGVRGGTSGRGR